MSHATATAMTSAVKTNSVEKNTYTAISCHLTTRSTYSLTLLLIGDIVSLRKSMIGPSVTAFASSAATPSAVSAESSVVPSPASVASRVSTGPSLIEVIVFAVESTVDAGVSSEGGGHELLL